MAVAAHQDRRPRHQSHQASAPRRSPSTRCSPSPTGSIRTPPPTRSAIWTKPRAKSSAALPSNDQVFAEAIKRSRVVLGESGILSVNQELDKKLPQSGLATIGEDPHPFLYRFPGLLRNVPVIETAAAGRGLFTIRPERDGIVRRVPVIMEAQGVIMPSLTFEMLRVVSGSDTILVKTNKEGIQSVGVKGFTIPTDKNGQLWVHFAKQDPSIYVSAIDVLEGRVPAGQGVAAAGAARHLGGRLERHQDHAGVAGDARRRDPCPGAGKRADRLDRLAAGLRHRDGIPRRDDHRHSRHHLRAEIRTGDAGRRRRGCSLPCCWACPGTITCATGC